MNLEPVIADLADELGDVLRKVGAGSFRVGQSLEFIASEFQLNLGGLTHLAESSLHPCPAHHSAVQRVIIPYLDFDVNVWLYTRGDELVIMDCAPDAALLLPALQAQGTYPSHLLITHDHPDHIGGREGIVSHFQALQPSHRNAQVLFTPGHCSHQKAYYFSDDKVCFCGDALFAYSMGRAEGARKAAYAQSVESLHTLLALPAETILYPGHGPATTVAWEREWNCFSRWKH